jgi:hypothetical protein
MLTLISCNSYRIGTKASRATGMTATVAGKTVLGGEGVPHSTSEVVMNVKTGTNGALLTGIMVHLVVEMVVVAGGEVGVAEEAESLMAHRHFGITPWMVQ